LFISHIELLLVELVYLQHRRRQKRGLVEWLELFIGNINCLGSIIIITTTVASVSCYYGGLDAPIRHHVSIVRLLLGIISDIEIMERVIEITVAAMLFAATYCYYCVTILIISNQLFIYFPLNECGQILFQINAELSHNLYLSTIAGTLEFSLITAFITPLGELILISIRGSPSKGEAGRL